MPSYIIPQSVDTLGYMPSNSDMLAVLDNCAGVLARYVSTASVQAAQARQTLKATLNPSLFALLDTGLLGLATNQRYDLRFRTDMLRILQPLEQALAQSKQLPRTWNLAASSPHSLDAWLTRANGVLGPSTPTTALTLTATGGNGGLVPCSLGNAPRVVYTYVGASDSIESLPSPESTQVALSGPQNGYSGTTSLTIPAGVFKIRLYRGVAGGPGGTYFFDQDVPVVAGQAFPLASITAPDNLLRQGIVPPAWLCMAQSPEVAALYALAWAGSLTAGQPDSPLRFTANAMLSPSNVLLNRSDGFVGVGNNPGGSVFATGTLTAANTLSNTPGSLQTTNNAPLNVQGYGGAAGLQARVVTALDAGCTLTISYLFSDALHGYGNAQTGTASATLSAGTAGTVGLFPIPAGRLVTNVTVTAVSGSATTGQVLVEGTFPRTY